jgi:hypothetical protein
MTTSASYMTPQPKWQRVNFTSATNRASNGTIYAVTGAFSFNSLSYRAASVVFNSPIDRLVIRFRNYSYPTVVTASGLSGSIADMRALTSPHVITLSKRKTGTLNLGSAGTSSGIFWFDEIYGEVLA